MHMWARPAVVFLLLYLSSSSPLPIRAETINFGLINSGLPGDLSKVYASSVNLAFSDFSLERGRNDTSMFVLHTRSSKADVVTAAAGALDLIKNVHVQAIIGPPTSMEAKFVAALGERAKVPILTFTATDPSLSVRRPYFFRASQNDATQTGLISAMMKAFQWKQAVPIYEENEFGEGILPFLVDAFESVDVRIPFRCAISADASEDGIHAALSDLMAMSTRVFIVHTRVPLGTKIFSMAKSLGMMTEGYVWITTDAMTNHVDSFGSSAIDSMQGVVGIRPYTKQSVELQRFNTRWKKKYKEDNPGRKVPKLNIYALWAYDAATALAIAVEQAATRNLDQTPAKAEKNSSTDLDNILESVSGPHLMQSLTKTNFSGLTGNFGFVDGQLPPTTYQIVNIIGRGYREIGFWGQQKGLSPFGLSPIIWPGELTSPPKGWILPIKGKKLRILVPVKRGDSVFVSVRTDAATNTTKVVGFTIDVFDEVVKALPYSLLYDYIPDPHGTENYDDLVHQVFLGNYDAAVGDITIVPNRSNYVTFSMPFTGSGVSILVLASYKENYDPSNIFGPFTWQVWLTVFCFVISIGFVVSLLERHNNDEFRHNISSDEVRGNLTRVVVIVWCFVVSILWQTFTASLASRLTVQQLQPVTVDIQGLITKNAPVGYSSQSFMRSVLKELGFKDRNLVPYSTFEECHLLFQNGTILAALDESPYLKPFITKHCFQYTAKPAFETGGFGFVFPIGSPLATDISRAVLKVVTTVYNTTTDGAMGGIEDKWFGATGSCSDSIPNPPNIGLVILLPLLMIVVAASVLALTGHAIANRW